MVADFNMLKIGFAAWLKSKNKEENTQTSGLTSSDISLFVNAEAFKEYLSEELNINFNTTSMSINDILNMEIVNGKLVDEGGAAVPAQTENAEDTFISGSENNGNGVTGLNSGEQEMLITNILNELISDETIQGLIDTDGNSKLNDEEIEAFMHAIKGLDGDESNISLSDLFSAIKGIKDNTFKIGDNETIQSEEAEATTVSTSDVSESSSSSSGGNSSSDSGSYNYSQNSADNKQNATQKSSLDGMSLEELNKELETTQNELTDEKTTLSNTLSGSTPELETLQGQVDEAYKAYKEQLELIDEDLAKEMEEKENAVNEAQADYDEKEQAVWDQEGVVNDCTTAYNNAVSKRENLEAIVANLEGTNSGEMSDEQKADLSSKLAAAKAQLETAKTEEQNAEKALDEAEKELTTREEAYEKAGEALKEAQQNKTEFEKALLEEHSEIKTYLDAYNKAKETYNTEKTTAITDARRNVEVSENYINEIKTAITKTENTQNEKEYKINSNGEYDEEEGQRLVETAKQMLEQYGSSSGYCATGVSRTINMAYGISMGGNGCDWDTNMEKLVEQGMFAEVTDDYPSSNDLSNLPAGAVVCWENTGGTNGGGAQYGHVAIADGNGGEISDHYQANIYKSIGGRSDQYRIFIPIS